MNSHPSLPPLPSGAQALVDQMENLQALGASRNVAMINEIFMQIAEAPDADASTILSRIRQVADYYIATRGQATQTIPNALAIILDGFDSLQGRSAGEVREWVVRQCRSYDAESKDWNRRLVGYGAALLDGARRIVAYDYSSTLVALLQQLARDGRSPVVIIPESRTLGGGRPIAKDLAASGLPMEFIPDCAMAHFIAGADAVLVGCETAYANGAVLNTVGSAMAALVASYYRVPFYVPTTLIKIDARSLHGRFRPIPDRSIADSLLKGWGDEAGAVTCPCPELDLIPPEHVTAFITEDGVLPPQALWAKAERFMPPAGR